MLQASALQPSGWLLKDMGDVAWHLLTCPAAQLDTEGEWGDQSLSEGTEPSHAHFKDDSCFYSCPTFTRFTRWANIHPYVHIHTCTHTVGRTQSNPLRRDSTHRWHSLWLDLLPFTVLDNDWSVFWAWTKPHWLQQGCWTVLIRLVWFPLTLSNCPFRI